MYAGFTFAGLGWGKTLLIAASGLVVVFLMLAALALLIMAISKAVGGAKGKQPAAAPVQTAPAAPVEVQDDEELVAVITAAVCAELGTTPDVTRLTRIMRY